MKKNKHSLRIKKIQNFKEIKPINNTAKPIDQNDLSINYDQVLKILSEVMIETKEKLLVE